MSAVYQNIEGLERLLSCFVTEFRCLFCKSKCKYSKFRSNYNLKIMIFVRNDSFSARSKTLLLPPEK